MRRPRFLNTILGVVIAAGCAGEPATPLEPQTPHASLLGEVTGAVAPLLLKCSELPAASAAKSIGKDGGVVSVGPYTLVVPKGALKSQVTITAEVVSDKVNSVRFTPEGLQFATGATLTMGYANCSGAGMLLPKKIVYTTEGLKLLEVLNSLDLFSQKKVTTTINHFSRYAIAY